MKGEKIFRILGHLDDDFICEAEEEKLLHKRSVGYYGKRLAIAACALLMVGIGIWSQNTLGSEPENTGIHKAPLHSLTIDTDGFYGGGMGFEGYAAYRIDDLVNANPWKETMQIESLPVFQNTYGFHDNKNLSQSHINLMKKKTGDIAASFGIDMKKNKLQDDFPEEDSLKQVAEKFEAIGEKVPPDYNQIGKIYMESDNIKIEVDASLTATVTFEPEIPLPTRYNFRHDSSYDELYQVGQYLKEEYAEVLKMKNPAINISGGDYSFTGQQIHNLDFFDNAGNMEQQILNYHFNNVTFACNDAGQLFLTRIFSIDALKKIGDYPLITGEEAKELLSEKKYMTTVPEEFPGQEYIRKTELVYRGIGYDQIHIPYYRFYVELPSLKLENGLNIYGAYYVPAVEEQYISNMPLWDGSFN